MVILAESWKLTGDLAQDRETFFDTAFHKFAERYRLVEPEVSAFVKEQEREARILRELETLRNRFMDREKPPLYGVPVGIKDLFHADGLLTGAGSELPSEVLTAGEGSLIHRLREQGCWVAGKTVTEEFAYAGPIPTRNPFAPDRTPGGSSAGAAACVAAGMCPVAVGTQTLRSVTAPASFCGVTGFKPSYGRIPMDGVILLAPSFDTAGIFTADAGSMAAVAPFFISEWKGAWQGREVIDPDRKPVLGIPNGIYMKFMTDEVRLAFEKQAATLIQAGYSVRTVDMPWTDDFIYGDAMLRFVQGEMARVHEPWYGEHKERYREVIRQAIELGKTIGEEELDRYRRGQLCLRSELAEIRRAQGIDLWISPAQGDVAPPHGGRTGFAGMTSIWTYAGLPTISLPGGQAEGLPLGFQCIAEFGQDEFLLHHAQGIAQFI
ncbi:amidase ['Paenibacillus yunnanensis' Narsing Rao et al. 2020]|uniref:amidase n=1 Tax=Paenibacillus tengchongensis TaxID=2608684 RepID=UPI00124D0146|nr:amidase [Paenibacillus tengchongensis]